MTRPLQLVVFDMDGTLIDSQVSILSGMRSGFATMGLEAPADAAILSVVGLSLNEAVAELAPQLPRPVVEEIAELYRKSFVEMRARTGGEASSPLYPGARNALERLNLRPEMLLGVATGKARRGLDHAYKGHGIGHYFVTSQTADNHPSKPHPSMLLAALNESGADAKQAVMIGDTEFDVAMGRAAGFATIGVSWGYHPVTRLHAAGADRVITSFDMLDAALDDLLAERLA